MTYEQIKQRLEQMQREYDRAVGRRDSAKDVLKKEFGVESTEEMKTLLSEMQNDFEVDDQKFADALKKFEKKYGNVLNPG